MVKDIILEAKNISKLYRLGTVGTGTFGGDVQRFWKTKILGQEDPFLKVVQTNDRTSSVKAEFVWALQDINFEVGRGEVLGIIGRNGAGKSTLLKLLSRITTPTTGSIKIAGRMASLLEVGTGFHPELTGRENVYLNGAILGMTKKEIRSKFDEIVDFSGCELYIDTPTKRYSSGMTVRLGFAVAAFLDPEILVVDEVLAVGDAEFQKKAIGKMREVSQGGGRTVLFVSHNMSSIKSLCDRAIVMSNGKLVFDGAVDESINFYLKDNQVEKHKGQVFQSNNERNADIYLKNAFLLNDKKVVSGSFEINEEIYIKINIFCQKYIPAVYGYVTVSGEGELLLIESDSKEFLVNQLANLKQGDNFFQLKIGANILPYGKKFVYFNFSSSQSDNFNIDSPGFVLSFDVQDNLTSRNIHRKAVTSQILFWEPLNE